jgi:hypothetical protein
LDNTENIFYVVQPPWVVSKCALAGKEKRPFTQGSFYMFAYGLSILLTSTAFMSTTAKYGIPLLRYTVFS